MKDSRGIERGKCKKCAHCSEYQPPDDGHKCSVCNCPPGAHVNTAASTASGTTVQPGSNSVGSSVSSVLNSMVTLVRQAWSDGDNGGAASQLPPQTETMEHCQPLISPSLASECCVPGCNQAVTFDMNTGAEDIYCSYHKSTPPQASTMMYMVDGQGGMDVEDVEMSVGGDSCGMQLQTMGVQSSYPFATASNLPSGSYDQVGLPHPMPSLPPGVKKCAIQECLNPCYVDDSGTVHECCGITHAMEHQRRLALWQQVNQQVVKGITHCYLPGCNRPTWPFHNYCGKTHAEEGKKMGLPPPPSLAATSAQTASTTGPKDSSMCIIPECNRAKYVDPQSGVTHDYCGRTHAQEGARRGIRATADKVEDQCELPGCTNKKRSEGTRVHDYCCLAHAQQDAPNRDARILTSDSQVQSFLKKFSNLTVVSLVENQHAKPGGVLFRRFKKAYNSLPKNQRQTCLAFHGTAAANIDSICKTGYDPSKRSGQAYGAGEYFATSPTIPLSYCKGGKKMLLNELLLGQSGTHHTKHGDIVVMKNPNHDLPRYVITFS